jgi:uncharacterized protein
MDRGGREMRAIRTLIGDPALARAARVAARSLIAAALMLPASGAVLADTMGGADVQTLGISGGGQLISINVDGEVLTVLGTGREVLPPDTADVTLGVSLRGAGASEVAQGASSAMTAVVAALTEAGIAEDAIQTTQLSLSPVYDYETEPPPIVGWEAANMVRVTVSDIDAVGDIVDAAVQAGANRIDGISFRVDDQSAAEAAARAAAVADASVKAGELAAAAGLELTGIISLSEIAGSSTEVVLEGQGDTTGGPGFATPVLPGTVDVIVSVSVAYGIG